MQDRKEEKGREGLCSALRLNMFKASTSTPTHVFPSFQFKGVRSAICQVNLTYHKDDELEHPPRNPKVVGSNSPRNEILSHQCWCN